MITLEYLKRATLLALAKKEEDDKQRKILEEKEALRIKEARIKEEDEKVKTALSTLNTDLFSAANDGKDFFIVYEIPLSEINIIESLKLKGVAEKLFSELTQRDLKPITISKNFIGNFNINGSYNLTGLSCSNDYVIMINW